MNSTDNIKANVIKSINQDLGGSMQKAQTYTSPFGKAIYPHLVSVMLGLNLKVSTK